MIKPNDVLDLETELFFLKKKKVNPNPFLTKKTLLLYFNPSPAEKETNSPK